MKNRKWDKPKSLYQLGKTLDKVCKVEGCTDPITQMSGVGSEVLCRKHQLLEISYGGTGKINRPHTFHRGWVCENCHYNPFEDKRVLAVEDEKQRHRIARIVLHGDHKVRKADGGDNSPTNITTLCTVCHAVKSVVNDDYNRKKSE